MNILINFKFYIKKKCMQTEVIDYIIVSNIYITLSYCIFHLSNMKSFHAEI